MHESLSSKRARLAHGRSDEREHLVFEAHPVALGQ
jgi:hypothetical protein